ncbi:uncharacterized protein LOC113312984 [Papaver somniferum]|uniref:uncharacterized protein LOC113312984 n=1 Tax=Papaver somniferum TaxID=3469 RepID=UPI000E7007BD|nr:uncharacterized protein LOC113312984 [Papaver somniferum]
MGTFKLPTQLINKLTAIQRKFFLGQNSNRGSNPIAWHKVCIPKELSGLAFRDLEMLNLALLTKLAWRLCNEDDALWTNIMGSKYFKNGDIIHQNLKAGNGSYTWNGIIKGIHVVKQNYFMEVKNGKKTKFWLDRWIPGMNSPPVPINDFFRFYQNVEELLLPETDIWSVDLLYKIFDINTDQKIMSIFLDTSKEDTMIWMPSRDDLHNTRYKLSIYNQNIAPHCDICGGSEETIKHLIFECDHANKIWRLSNVDIETVYSNHYSVSEWEVSLNPVNSVHKIIYHMHSHLHELLSNNINLNALLISQWKPPLPDIFKFNFDASFCYITKTLGSGVVLRTSEGSCERIKGNFSNGVLSPKAGECMAIREALTWAKDKQMFKIHIEADAQLVIQSITDDVLLIQRDNQVTDAVAKSVRGTAININISNNFPSDFCSLLARDTYLQTS